MSESIEAFLRRAALILIGVLILFSPSKAPMLSGKYLDDRKANEQYVAKLIDYKGYQKLLRQTDTETTMNVIKMIENSSYPEYVKAIIEVESSWNVNALSNRDARGLMQVRPIAGLEIEPDIDPSELFDPETNVRIGIDIFDNHLEYYYGYDDPMDWVLTSYNRGIAGTRALHMNPPSTRYSRKVSNISRKFVDESDNVNM